MIHPSPYSGSAFAGLRIGLLGGSFNPAHQGHLAMSRYALKRLGLDQVWWLVSPQNPLKPAQGMMPFRQRLQNAAALTAGDPAILVSALESELGTCYTVDTVQALQQCFSQTHFVWLMGADNLRQFSRWRRWADLFQTVPIAVFRRPGYAAGRGCGKAAIRFDAAWQPTASARNLALQTAPAWLVLDNQLNGLSATLLRRQRS